MSIGYKIKKLREERNLSQPELSEILKISQSDLSKIENDKTQKIDFLFMQRVCDFFEKDYSFFVEGNSQINNIKKIEGCINNHGTINLTPENLMEQIKSVFDENKILKEENKRLKKSTDKG